MPNLFKQLEDLRGNKPPNPRKDGEQRCKDCKHFRITIYSQLELYECVAQDSENYTGGDNLDNPLCNIDKFEPKICPVAHDKLTAPYCAICKTDTSKPWRNG